MRPIQAQRDSKGRKQVCGNAVGKLKSSSGTRYAVRCRPVKSRSKRSLSKKTQRRALKTRRPGRR